MGDLRLAFQALVVHADPVGTSLGERAGEHRMLSPDGSTRHDGETLDVNAGGVTPMT